MRWTHVLALGAVASIAATAACGAPASKDTGTTSDKSTTDAAPAASAGLLPDAKGPAPEVTGAKKGGTLTVSYSTNPSGMDPSSQFYQDSAAILKLTNRSLTTFALRDGKSVLVPDLATDLGKASADGMDWTFTLKDGLKYEDGSPVKAEDVAYAVKRSFAQEELPGGPTYQNDFLKGGDTYKGPYKSGDTFAGVSTPDDKTVVIHLRKKFETLPYFVSFSQFSPIPKAKDTKQNYSNHPIATGPYMFKTYTQGTKLELVKNPNWDPATDPARHQYLDGYTFNFGVDTIKTQQAILASNGPDATTLNWEPIDAQFIDQVTGAKKDQFVNGPSSCTVAINLDTRKIPLEVRKALAAAYPFDQVRKAAGLTSLSAPPAHTLIPPQVPGALNYTLPGLTGTGKGDPAAAKKMLADAGKTGFELKFYYTNDDPIAQQTNLVRKQALEAAGFKVKDMGVPGKERRSLIADPKANTNMLQSPAGWCFDWPSGDAIFPPTVSSTVMKAGGTGWGNLSDPKIDSEINRISAMSIAEQGPEWGKFDKWLMETYLPAIPYYYDKGNFLFGTKVHGVVDDPNHGMPFLENIWVDQ
jgi:peptide/nickel transport system substrate-binding protein